MNYRYIEARESKGLSRPELAEKLGVHYSTLTNWETGRRDVPTKILCALSDELDCTVDYLLGYDRELLSLTEPVTRDKLIILHSRPVWTASLGWLLVDSINCVFVQYSMKTIPFDDVTGPIFMIPPALALSLHGTGNPLSLEDVLQRNRVWVEAITIDPILSNEVRGWYHMFERRLVQNEHGTRFYLDTYGVKWLAFDSCFERQEY